MAGFFLVTTPQQRASTDQVYKITIWRTALTCGLLLTILTAFASSGDCSNVQTERWEGQSLNVPAGAPVHGLAVSLSASKSVVHVGKPLDVLLEIRNVSGTEMHVRVGTRFGAYRIRIVNAATGETLKRRLSPRSGLDSIGGPSRGDAFEPGRSRFETLHLSDMYAIDRPGVYRINVLNVRIAVPPDAVEIKDSNTVTVTVLPEPAPDFAYGDDVRQMSGGPRGAPSQDLTLAIGPASTRFKLGQPIDLTANIQNNSSATVHVWRTNRARFKYDVKDDRGHVAPIATIPHDEEYSAGSGGWDLAPNQELTFRIRLNDYVVLDHPGTYTIRVEEQVPMVDVKRAKTRVQLTSNVLTINLAK